MTALNGIFSGEPDGTGTVCRPSRAMAIVDRVTCLSPSALPLTGVSLVLGTGAAVSFGAEEQPVRISAAAVRTAIPRARITPPLQPAWRGRRSHPGILLLVLLVRPSPRPPRSAT